MSEDPVKYEPLSPDTTARDATTVALERIQALEEHLAGHGNFATQQIRIEALRAAAAMDQSGRPEMVKAVAKQFAAYLESGE